MKMRKIALSLSVSLGLGLGVAGPAAAADLEAMKQEARALAGDFVKELGGALQKEMKANGPGSAIGVCKNLAPEISSRLSREKGWQVTRVSLKVRDPLLGMPDPWQQTGLAEFDKAAAGGSDPATLEVAEVVEEPAGKYFRYMKAIPTGKVCLNCHGAAGELPEPVVKGLAADYPHDQALGYKEGQIRGAIAIKRPL